MDTTQAPPTLAGPDAAAQLQGRQHFAWLVGQSLTRPVRVVWHHNRVRLASFGHRAGVTSLRLHVTFARGDAAVAQALVRYLCRRSRADGAYLSQWFAKQPWPLVAPPAARPPLGRPLASPSTSPSPSPAPAVAAADVAAPLLQSLFDALNAAYFHRGCRASIRWGRSGTPKRRRRRSIQLGCYDFGRGEIRIHPVLQAPFVPRYVVESVVFHEMLHEVFGLEEHNGRRRAHPPAFAACEQSHPDYARARAWEAQHLPQLLAWRA